MNKLASAFIPDETRQTLDDENTDLPSSWYGTVPSRKRRLGVRGIGFLLISVLPTIGFAIYLWGFAADQYVSEFRFTVQHSIPVTTADRGVAGGSVGTDALMALALAESESAVGYIKSRQILDDIADKIDLSRIYATPKADWYWRLDRDAPIEDRLRYWNRVVTPVFDLTTGIVTVDVRTFSPEDSEKVAKAVQVATEAMVNDVSDRSRRGAETYAATLVTEAEQRLRQAEEKLRDFRNANTVLTPELSAGVATKIEGELRSNIAGMQAKIGLYRLQGVRDDAPRMVVLRNQLATLKDQLNRQIAEVTHPQNGAGPGQRPLASAISDYDALETERSSSIFPRRPRWLATFFVASVFTWALVLLFGYSIRDHID